MFYDIIDRYNEARRQYLRYSWYSWPFWDQSLLNRLEFCRNKF